MAEEHSKKHERTETEGGEQAPEKKPREEEEEGVPESDDESEDLSSEAQRKKRIGTIEIKETDRFHRVITADEDCGIRWLCIPEDFWVAKVQAKHARYLEAINRKAPKSSYGNRKVKGETAEQKAARQLRQADNDAKQEFHQLMTDIWDALPSTHKHPSQDAVSLVTAACQDGNPRHDSHDFDPALQARLVAPDHFVMCYAFE
jgi:hypothetical protein